MNIRYADDSAVITEKMLDIQKIIAQIEKTGNEFGLGIKYKESEAYGKREGKPERLNINGTPWKESTA